MHSCLVDQNGLVKISDFGLARIKYQTHKSSTRDQGTIPYMAPECFDQSLGRVTVRSDIYSAGILIGEMINGERPWGAVKNVSIMYQVVHQRRRPPLTEDAVQCPPSLRQLLLDCVSHEAEKRPTASSVLSRLREIQQEKTPEPDASSSAHQSSKFSDYFEGWKNLYIAEKWYSLICVGSSCLPLSPRFFIRPPYLSFWLTSTFWYHAVKLWAGRWERECVGSQPLRQAMKTTTSLKPWSRKFLRKGCPRVTITLKGTSVLLASSVPTEGARSPTLAAIEQLHAIGEAHVSHRGDVVISQRNMFYHQGHGSEDCIKLTFDLVYAGYVSVDEGYPDEWNCHNKISTPEVKFLPRLAATSH